MKHVGALSNRIKVAGSHDLTYHIRQQRGPYYGIERTKATGEQNGVDTWHERL